MNAVFSVQNIFSIKMLTCKMFWLSKDTAGYIVGTAATLLDSKWDGLSTIFHTLALIWRLLLWHLGQFAISILPLQYKHSLKNKYLKIEEENFWLQQLHTSWLLAHKPNDDCCYLRVLYYNYQPLLQTWLNQLTLSFISFQVKPMASFSL